MDFTSVLLAQNPLFVPIWLLVWLRWSKKHPILFVFLRPYYIPIAPFLSVIASFLSVIASFLSVIVPFLSAKIKIFILWCQLYIFSLTVLSKSVTL